MGISHQIVALAGFVFLAGNVQASCSPDRLGVFGDFGRAYFSVTLADDDQERAQGLMNVAEMATMSGMLFAYDAPRPVAFWMRNTLIPLDMLFVSSNGQVQRIHHNAKPLDETVIDGGPGIQFVLEINGGMAARLGIQEGDVIQHPLIVEDAKRPCE